MIKKLCACTILALGLSAGAHAAAPACGAATAAPLGSSTGAVDTSSASGGITGIGPYATAGNQVVWTFTTGPSPATDMTGRIDITGDWGWGLFITTSCYAGVPTSDLVDQLGGNASSPAGDTQTWTPNPADFSPNTQYFIILSGLDAANNAGIPVTGTSTLTFNSTLPVKLQNFSAK